MCVNFEEEAAAGVAGGGVGWGSNCGDSRFTPSQSIIAFKAEQPGQGRVVAQ